MAKRLRNKSSSCNKYIYTLKLALHLKIILIGCQYGFVSRLATLDCLLLRVETRRYDRARIERNERVCTFCNLDVEDEYRFIIACLIYNDIRRKYLKPYYTVSTLVISKSKGSSQTLRDIRTSTYQMCRIEENTNRTTKFHK